MDLAVHYSGSERTLWCSHLYVRGFWGYPGCSGTSRPIGLEGFLWDLCTEITIFVRWAFEFILSRNIPLFETSGLPILPCCKFLNISLIQSSSRTPCKTPLAFHVGYARGDSFLQYILYITKKRPCFFSFASAFVFTAASRNSGSRGTYWLYHRNHWKASG